MFAPTQRASISTSCSTPGPQQISLRANGDSAIILHPVYNFNDEPTPSPHAALRAWLRRGCRLYEGGCRVLALQSPERASVRP